MKANKRIRDAMKKANLFTWEVAEQLSIHENTLFRLLRRELPDEKQEKVLEAIRIRKKIKEQKR